jgi:hypothetical protein
MSGRFIFRAPCNESDVRELLLAGDHHVITERAIVERVAQAVVASFPFAFCFSCLATHLGLTEKDARSAAQIVIGREGFRVEQRSCYGCNRTERVLVGEKI